MNRPPAEGNSAHSTPAGQCHTHPTHTIAYTQCQNPPMAEVTGNSADPTDDPVPQRMPGPRATTPRPGDFDSKGGGEIRIPETESDVEQPARTLSRHMGHSGQNSDSQTYDSHNNDSPTREWQSEHNDSTCACESTSQHGGAVNKPAPPAAQGAQGQGERGQRTPNLHDTSVAPAHHPISDPSESQDATTAMPPEEVRGVACDEHGPCVVP